METGLYATALTAYEERQVAGICAWKDAEPGRLARLMNFLTRPLGWLVQVLLPESVVQRALDLSHALAQRLTDQQFVLDRAGLASLDELARLDLETIDALAEHVHRRSVALAAGQGACTGALGLPGLFLDIPVVITVALRTIHRVGLCYGYDVRTRQDVRFVYGILAAAGANTRTEKRAAVGFIRSLNTVLLRRAWVNENAIAVNMGEAGVGVAFRTLGRQLGINISKRECFSVLPLIGALVSAFSNALWIRQVGWAARRAYQERWLIDRGKIVE